MRYFLSIFIVCLIAFASVFSGPAFSQRHLGYCDNALSSADTMKCVNKHNVDVQEKLQKTFKALLDTQEADAKTALNEAQKSWLIYRDSQCAWEASLSDTPALERVYELSCLTAITNSRVSLLSSVKEQAEEKAPREFGSQPRWINALAADYPDIFWRYGEEQAVDFDCDGQQEQVMKGIAVNYVQDAVQIDEQSASEQTHRELELVVAISDNPETGRPKATLFRLPVSEALDEGLPHLCRPAAKLTLYKRYIEAAVEGEEPKEDAKQCENSLLISDKICKPLHIYWDGKSYQLEPQGKESGSL